MPCSGSGMRGSIASRTSTRSCETAALRTHLRSAGTTYQGAHAVDVSVIASSYALRYVVPVRAVVEVRHAELPPLLRVVDAGLQPLALLVEGDVKEDLHDGGAFVHEHALELADVAVARAATPTRERGRARAPRARPHSASG